MLELRPTCENCRKSLPPDSTEAMICTYECTFCVSCVEDLFSNVCPNCGGGFEKRPVRPKGQLERNPPTDHEVYKPVDMTTYLPRREKLKEIPPESR